MGRWCRTRRMSRPGHHGDRGLVHEGRTGVVALPDSAAAEVPPGEYPGVRRAADERTGLLSLR